MKYNLCDMNTVQRLLRQYGFTFSKALGQNFLIDEDICPAMAAALRADNTTGVLEIGPGIGVLTAELCKVAGKVAAVELDKRLYPVLEETLGDFTNFTLIEGDAMQLDLATLLNECFGGMEHIKVCANLPYYITSPVIMRLLESRLPIEEIVVMVQREAGERLCAKMGTRQAGAVSAAVQYFGEAQVLFEVDRTSFMPAPKVDSSVIKITLHREPKYHVNDEKAFFTLVRAAFAQRRKTAVNSISATLGIPKETVANALSACGVAVNARAENLTMEELAALSEVLAAGK